MTFIESIRTCFRKFAVFKGRAVRSEFWWFQLFGLALTLGGFAADHLLLGYSLEETVTPLAAVFSAVIVIPNAAVTARRLHDIGLSGFFQLPGYLVYTSYLDIWSPGFSLSLIGNGLISVGMLTWFALYIVLIKKGRAGSNKYGPAPQSENIPEVFN